MAESSKFSIDTSGLNDAVNAVQKAAEGVTDAYEDMLDTSEDTNEHTVRYNSILKNVNDAFTKFTVSGADPLSDENFNMIIEELVEGDSTFTVAATNSLRDTLLNRDDVDEANFSEVLANIIMQYDTNESADLDDSEFKKILNTAEFKGNISDDN